MNNATTDLTAVVQQAVSQKDWPTVEKLAAQILADNPNNIDGYYLRGIAHRAQRRNAQAIDDYRKALDLGRQRYDIAIELANLYSIARRNADAAALLGEYEGQLNDSPRYLDLAGTIYTEVGMAHKAWPLFKRANELQPGVDIFQANLATCAVYLGKVQEAKETYQRLLERSPEHRKNHYQLSRLDKATDYQHIDQMKAILAASKEKIDRDVPLYFAIAKELEDLEQWDESFDYYRQAGEAVLSITKYDVTEDVTVIEDIIKLFGQDWFNQDQSQGGTVDEQTPVFIVGLPRTGTTLVERILSSHSKVSSLGETLFMQMGIRKLSGEALSTRPSIDKEVLQAVASKNPSELRDFYLNSVKYRLSEEPFFIEKLPLNILYLGLILKAWPNAKIIHMVRNPMDACFSMFKQVFTWAYKYSYSIDHLAQYYVAYNALREHWNSVLGDRIIEVEYEQLIGDQEAQTRQLLDHLGLPFEQACLDFEKNVAPSTTASSVQVRAKVHSGSVEKWRRFEEQLAPLRAHLEANGIEVDAA